MDIVLTGAALFVSAVSLWVGIRTEDANEKLVAASTWPFLEVEINNATPEGRPSFRFNVVNAGVGPAKIESFEVFWKGKPFPTTTTLLKACCGFTSHGGDLSPVAARTPLLTGSVQGIVLRSGEVETFIQYDLGHDNAAVWNKINRARPEFSYRLCYCSALDECWQTDIVRERSTKSQLHPSHVQACPVPKVPYTL